ncbi:MAG: hypothetical protein LBM60_01740, partial [Clostridium sp.]|nr:hypothetical protein [Clostridium sp.]
MKRIIIHKSYRVHSYYFIKQELTKVEKPSIYQNYFRKEDMGRPYENWGALLHDWFALWDVHLQVLLSTGGIYLELPLKQENATQIWECLKLNGGEKVISAELLTQIRKMEEHIENRVRNACSGEKIKTVSTNGHTRGKYQNRMYDVSKNEWCITTTKTHENNSSVSARIDHFLEVFSPSKLTIYALTAALSTEFCRSYERIYASLQDDIGLTQPS